MHKFGAVLFIFMDWAGGGGSGGGWADGFCGDPFPAILTAANESQLLLHYMYL